jgi:hypothetical protein
VNATLTLANGEHYAVTLVEFKNAYPAYEALSSNMQAVSKKLSDSQSLKRPASFGFVVKEKLA